MLLNVTPDHLDRHGTLEDYRDAKRAIFAHQDAATSRSLPAALGALRRGRRRTRSTFGGDGADLALRDGALRWRGRAAAGADEIAAARRAQRRERDGRRGRGAGPRASSADAVRRGAARRSRASSTASSRSRRVDGVTWVNDSKATNVASHDSSRSRRSTRRVHLILGGQAQGQSFDGAARAASRRAARAVYLVGEAAAALARGARGRACRSSDCGDLAARGRARPRGAAQPARSCCSRRPARASTSSGRLRGARRALQGARRSARPMPGGGLRRRGAEGAVRWRAPPAPRPPPARAHARRRVEEDVLLTAVHVPARLRRGDGLQRVVGATRVLQGGGDGTGYLVRYLIYGALGLVRDGFVARRPLRRSWRSPARCSAIALVLPASLVQLPGSASRSTARGAGSAPGPLLPAERDREARARPLRRALPGRAPAARPHARRPAPLGLVAAARRRCSSPSQPDLGTTLVIAATVLRCCSRRACPMRCAGDARRLRRVRW